MLVTFILSLLGVLSLHAQTTVWVAPVTGAKLLWLAPNMTFSPETDAEITNAWAVQRTNEESAREMTVPVQTGRALLVDQKFSLRGDVLAKGTGFNDDDASRESVARIRYEPTTKTPTQGDGLFTVRESFADMVASQKLAYEGVVVPKPVAIFSTGANHLRYKAALGVYVREFIHQTRLSNLEVMSNEDARAALDDASQKLFEAGHTHNKLNRVELFFFLMKRMAKTTAILQTLGYQHSYLHWQQVTLAGELADLGTGTWTRSQETRPYEIPRPLTYMAFENQPMLVSNMFVRTHSLTAEGGPQRLSEDSETLRSQKNSLLGVYRRIDPAAAAQIEQMSPEDLFEDFYQMELRAQAPRTAIASLEYSESLSSYLRRHQLILSASDSAQISKLFEDTKRDWSVRSLPDAFVAEHLLRGRASPKTRRYIGRWERNSRCREGAAGLGWRVPLIRLE